MTSSPIGKARSKAPAIRNSIGSDGLAFTTLKFRQVTLLLFLMKFSKFVKLLRFASGGTGSSAVATVETKQWWPTAGSDAAGQLIALLTVRTLPTGTLARLVVPTKFHMFGVTRVATSDQYTVTCAFTPAFDPRLRTRA